jgi:YbgC/YbaW family acyl-CoA thioester hydrolase
VARAGLWALHYQPGQELGPGVGMLTEDVPPVPGAPTAPVLARTRQRVAMADVDAARVIYYAAPYRWHEALFTGWLAEVGHPLGLMLESGVSCPCVRSGATYHRPLHLDDLVDLELVAERVGRTSMVLRTDVRTSDGELAVQVTNTLVWTELGTNGSLSAVAVPTWMRDVFALHQHTLDPAGSDGSSRPRVEDKSEGP